jgi:hypothetical protein
VANRKKLIFNTLFILLLLIMVVLFVSSYRQFMTSIVTDNEQESSEMANEAPVDDVGEEPNAVWNDADFQKAGETERLELFFRSNDSAIMVKDKQNGYVWRSAYPLKDTKLGNDLWTASSQSIFHLTYTDPNLPALEIHETNSAIEQPEIVTTKIDNGVMVHYELPQLGIGFSMGFQVKGNSLEVTVPGKSVKDSSQFWLMSLAPLPFFGSAGDDEQGYAFYPDGPGALSYFKKNHPRYLNPYRASVYGPDRVTFMKKREEIAMLPVFGLKVGSNAFVGMITEGEHDASILYGPSGHLINLNRVSSELTYRRVYEATKKNGNLTKQAEKKLMRGDHTIRYVFFSGDEADYSQMAAAYRDYLIEEKGLTSRIKKDDPIPYGLDLLTGIMEKRILFDRFIPTTTLEQAKLIFKDLQERGVRHISANLLGWTTDGYMSYPSRLPAARQLGGGTGLKQLSEFAKKNGIKLYLQDNFIDAFSRVGGFSVRNDVVREANSFPVTNRFGDMFLINARKANLAFQDNYLDKLETLSIAGIHFEGFGSLDFYDYHIEYPLSREGTAEQWMEMMDKSRKQFGGAAVTGGNGYVLSHTDRLFDIPMKDSGYFFTDEAVPFYQMVVHGLIPYSGNPQNLFYDPEMQYLKMVEYGYMPYYQLTKQYSKDLKYTDYNLLFTSSYDNWVDVSVKQYKEMNEKLGRLWSQTIRQHRKLQPEVFEVTYEDGTRVIVNYLPQTLHIDGESIPGKNYVVLPKEE